MKNQSMPATFLANFIHDIIETDYKADVLRELGKQCKTQANLIKEKSNEAFGSELKKVESIKEELKNLARHKDSSGEFKEQYTTVYHTAHRKVKTKFLSGTRIFNYYIVFFVITLISMIIAISHEIIPNAYCGLAISLLFPIPLSFLCSYLYVVLHPESDESYEVKEQKNITNYANKEQSIIKRLAFAEKNYEIALEQKKECHEIASSFEEKAQFFEQQAKKLDAAKTKMLDLNIIPQDYRDLVCLFELHKIFRNNLADTMREAIAIYEERAFRGIVVQGIYQMNHKINLISEYITDMSDNLHTIRTNSNFMINEIQRIREIRERDHDNQNQLLDEMRAVRYANQATLQSQERCERYINYQYWKN
ncbi:MAG: hypothetical protein IKD07_02180 [Clostridia bacterium]|nr:hypothetical protein [Clostridia bacterium]